MSDAEGSARGGSAGALLRAAREKQGLHIAALAAAMKVSPRRLEALEADRYDELLDPTFARALAQSMCRALKVDAAPVLALLPQGGVAGARLEQVSGGLKTPFRERGGPHHDRSEAASPLRRPAFWATALVLAAAAALYLLPADWLAERWATLRGSAQDAPTAAVPAEAAGASAPASSPDAAAPLAALPAAPLDVPAAAEPAVEAPPPSAPALLVLHTNRDSWVEVRDGSGQALLFRTLQAGESAEVDGTPPLKVTIGNAAATELRFRGAPVDLAASTRDNVARLELK